MARAKTYKWKKQSSTLSVNQYKLDSSRSRILYVTGVNANGLNSLNKDLDNIIFPEIILMNQKRESPF